MKLLSYTLSRLEIYFITCTYRTSVLRSLCERVREMSEISVYACMRCVGKFVESRACMLAFVRMARKKEEKKRKENWASERGDAETPQRRESESDVYKGVIS